MTNTAVRAASALTALLLVAAAGTPAQAQDLPERTFEDETWSEGLVDLRSIDLTRTHIDGSGYAGRSLGVSIPEGGFRGFGPFDRLGEFENAETAPDEVWFRYHIRLIDWDAASTGKLPGLAGIYSSSARGCLPSTPSQPGWSARGMFGAPGTHGAAGQRVPIGSYIYHLDQPDDCGEGFWWDGPGLEEGRWHCIEGHVRMNTPGSGDGVIRGWLDGNLGFEKTDLSLRRVGEESIGVRHMWHNVYFGGQWPTPNPLSLEYDEVSLSTDGRVGCLQAFTDLSTTIHERSVIELHALGYLRGCDYRLACPHRELTRGEAAAFITRIAALGPATADYFTDDDGTTFENDINRLAEAGITDGCAPRLYCPDRTMTRAEFAKMLDRTLGLTGSAPNAFNDDDGHWAEDSIDRLAREGITSGCGRGRFCPERALPRDEAIALFERSLDLLEPVEAVAGATSIFPPSGEPPAIPEEEQD